MSTASVMNETTSDTLDTSIAPVPAVLRRRITDAIDAVGTTVTRLDQATLAIDDIAASREDGQETTAAELDAVAEPLRDARRHAKYLQDTVLFELDEKVGHAHAPDDLAERAKEIDDLLGDLQAAVIHIEGEIVREDEATTKARKVVSECFHDLRLITATMRLPSIVGDGGAS
jgi:hypothetical protein